MTPAAVTIRLPTVLWDAVGHQTLRVKGRTLEEALEEAYRAVPALRHHLCESSGRFRTHVLCFLNDRSTRDLPSMEIPLREGDTITIHQAVSGG